MLTTPTVLLEYTKLQQLGCIDLLLLLVCMYAVKYSKQLHPVCMGGPAIINEASAC